MPTPEPCTECSEIGTHADFCDFADHTCPHCGDDLEDRHDLKGAKLVYYKGCAECGWNDWADK